MRFVNNRWMALVAANVLAWGMFGLYQASVAQQPKGPQLPFANSNLQRSDILSERLEIKELIKEQNTLLRQGAGNVAGDARQ